MTLPLTAVPFDAPAHCPSCQEALVLRCGPTRAPHYAHRPRQSCRARAAARAARPVQWWQEELPFPGPPPPPRAVRRYRRRPSPRLAKARRRDAVWWRRLLAQF